MFEPRAEVGLFAGPVLEPLHMTPCSLCSKLQATIEEEEDAKMEGKKRDEGGSKRENKAWKRMGGAWREVR
jgi:hypothetical protein